MFVGMLCGAAAWPLLTLLMVWIDDAQMADGPFVVLVLPLFALWSILGIPATLMGPGYVQFALVEALWTAVGGMAAGAGYDRRERRRRL